MRVLSGKGDWRGKGMMNGVNSAIKRRPRMHDAMGDVKDQFTDRNRKNQSPEYPGSNGIYVVPIDRKTILFVAIGIAGYGEDWSSEELLRYQV